MLMVYNVSLSASLLPERGYLVAQRPSVSGWLLPLSSLGGYKVIRPFFSFFSALVFQNSGRRVDMRQLSPCVKPQVLVVRMSRPPPSEPPTLHPLHPCCLLGDAEMGVTTGLMRKGERVPRSGGLLHSALLISQAPLPTDSHRLPLPGCSPGAAARLQPTARSDPRAEASSRRHIGQNIQEQPAVGQQHIISIKTLGGEESNNASKRSIISVSVGWTTGRCSSTEQWMYEKFGISLWCTWGANVHCWNAGVRLLSRYFT